jgi:hypothetical protein
VAEGSATSVTVRMTDGNYTAWRLALIFGHDGPCESATGAVIDDRRRSACPSPATQSASPKVAVCGF